MSGGRVFRVQMSPELFDACWNAAAGHYIREEPRKRWTDKEKTAAVKWWLGRLAEKAVAPKNYHTTEGRENQ